MEYELPADDLKRRLLWRCRRGTKELDTILATFMQRAYHGLNAAERSALERLLDVPDPQLTEWLCRGIRPAEPETAALVERILSAHRG